MRPQNAPRPPAAPRARPAKRTPWDGLQAELAAMGGPAEVLSTGRPTLDRGTLMIHLPGGRPLAEGRRALRDAAVVEAVSRHYGERVKADANALPNTGSANDQREALKRTVLADPDMQRILAALGGKLTRAVPLTDGD